MTNKLILTCSLVALASLTNGCSRHETVPEAEFGDAVHNVMNSQIHDYEAAIHPNPNAVEGSDPYRLDASLETYRQDVSRPEEVQQPVTISIGSQR